MCDSVRYSGIIYSRPVYTGESDYESNIAARWILGKSILLFTLNSGKNEREISLSRHPVYDRTCLLCV